MNDEKQTPEDDQEQEPERVEAEAGPTWYGPIHPTPFKKPTQSGSHRPFARDNIRRG